MLCCDSKKLKWILHWCWRHFYFTFENVNEIENRLTVTVVEFWVSIILNLKGVVVRTYAFVCKSSVNIWIGKLLSKFCLIAVLSYKYSNNSFHSIHSAIDLDSTSRQNDWHNNFRKMVFFVHSMANIKEIVAIIEACRLWRFVKKIKSAFGDKVGRQIKQFNHKICY